MGAKTQCLSKEIGVGVAIPCWRRSEVIVMSYMHVYNEIRSACYTLKQIIISSLCIRRGFRLSVWTAT